MTREVSGMRRETSRPGDVVWFPSVEKHWHGAAPTTAMTHIAIQEKLDGKPVDLSTSRQSSTKDAPARNSR